MTHRGKHCPVPDHRQSPDLQPPGNDISYTSYGERSNKDYRLVDFSHVRQPLRGGSFRSERLQGVEDTPSLLMDSFDTFPAPLV